MLIYSLPIIVGMLGAILQSRRLFFFLMVFLTILVGFGVDVGADYFAYIDIYESAPSIFDENFLSLFRGYYSDNGIEIFFATFNVILKSAGMDGQFIFLLMSALSSIFIYKICKKFSLQTRYIIFAIVYVLIFSGLWNQIRYGLAILIVFYTCLIYLEKKYLCSFALFVLATGIHSISLAIIFVIFAYEFLRKRKISIPLLAFAFISISLALSFIDGKLIIMSILQSINPRYSAYIETEGSQFNYLIRALFFMGMFLLVSKQNIKNDNLLFFLFVMAGSSLLVWSIAWRIDVLYRVGVMYEFGYLLFIMRIAYSKKAYFLTGTLFLFLLMLWRLVKGVDILNDYNFYSLIP